MMEKVDTFWMVWNEGNRAPTVKHASMANAKTEAERLARNNPNQTFHVLQLVGACRKMDVKWVFVGVSEVKQPDLRCFVMAVKENAEIGCHSHSPPLPFLK